MRIATRSAIVATTAALAASVLTVAPAHADPTVDWTPLPGFPVVAPDYSAGLAAGLSAEVPWGLSIGTPSGPIPVIAPTFENTSDHDLTIGFGLDLFTAGEPDRLWHPDVWQTLFPDVDADELASVFAETVAPGDVTQRFDPMGAPEYAGRTFAVYLIDDQGTPEQSDDTDTVIAQYTAPGRFVPLRTDGTMGFDFDAGFAVGQEAAVAGEAPELFPGVQATATASGLTPGESLEMWLAPDLDYFFLMLTGGVLPTTAVKVGDTTVRADGSVSATFAIPADAPLGDYQLVLGDSAERYWPAGGYHSFSVRQPAASSSAATPAGASTQSLAFGVTSVELGFPAGTTAGTTTVAASGTGPVAEGFRFASAPPLFYHVETTSQPGGPVEVCIVYSTANLPGPPPRLYHHELAGALHNWVDITTSQQPGRVCGETTSFSPFVLGIPDGPVDDGSAGKPARGVLSDDNGWDTGLKDGDYRVTMNLWWGENASRVRLYENGALIAEQTLARATPSAQQAVFPIAGRVNGSYVYTAELENSRGVTTTAPLTVKVTQASPGKPSLSTAGTVKAGATFTVRADLWWGTNATSWRMLRDGVEIAHGALAAATPAAQSVAVPVSLPKGSHSFVVEFANAAGTTASSPLAVKVR